MSPGEGVLTGPLASHLTMGGKKPGFSKGELVIAGGHQERQNQNNLEQGVTGLAWDFYKPKRKCSQQKRNFL